jgi:subtilisin-like proprotein convertase family protein
MQKNITLKNLLGWGAKVIMMIFVTLCFFTGALKAQYSNGNLSTGNNSGGTAAPAGYNWSEIQGANINFGFGGSIAGGLTLADNFVVPAGQTWIVSKITFYAYSTSYAGATSPFNDLRLQIFNVNPSVGTPAPVFGNLTANVLSASPEAFLYRIAPGGATTGRKIWKMEANISTTLAAGTYWLEWQNGTIAGVTSNFFPAKTIVGAANQAGDNALQHTLAPSAWAPVLDGTTPQDMPFDITYSTSGAPCTGTPAPGNTLSTITTGCAAAPFTLSLQNVTSGLGVTYQWQTAASATGPWTNITGATSPTYSSSVTTGAFYHCLVTCSGNVGTSSNLQVALTPSTACYCTTSLASSTADEDIFNVTVSTLNNSSTCTTLAPGPGSIVTRYSNYTSGTGAPAVPNVIAGANNPFSVQIGTCGGNFTNSTAIFIDLNQDGVLAATERVYVSSIGIAGPHAETGVLVIPATATLGNTRMRVINVETGTPGSITACGGYTWGETEDYTINLVGCVPLTIATNPANASAFCGANASFTATANGTIPSYSWQYRINATSPWQIVPNAAPYTGANTATLSVAADASLNGYQFRAAIQGACIGSATDFSTEATLTVNQLVLPVSPATATICNNTTTPVLITVPNTSNTVSFSSTGAVAVPDNNPAPTLSNITVSGIPAGANILDVTITLNMSHTYPGDMIFNLKAPNAAATSNIINLYKYANGAATGPASGVPTWGWYGAKISSNGTAAFNTTVPAAPFIYNNVINWKADLRNTTVGVPANFPFDNPTGYVSNATSFNQVASSLVSPNGVWTMAMADGGPGDIGTLTSWKIDITYGGAPATASFTPITGLFTNAAATIPYVTGTQVTQVYALPIASTTYTAAVGTATCTAVPSTTVVTVNTAITGTLTVANNSLCAGGNATFSFAGLTTGTGLTYQWQMSTDGGATYANIAGATSATYVVSAATTAMSGNRYRVILSAAPCVSTAAATSSAGTLTVNPTPVVTISAAPITKLFPGLISTLTAAVSPNAAINYTWYRNGILIPNAITNRTVVNVDQLGTYTVAVTDVNGCSAVAGTSTPASIVISDSVNTDRLFIYPSPNNGNFQVRYYTDLSNGSPAPAAVNVYDEKGSLVFSQAYKIGSGYQPMNVSISPAHGRGIYRVDVIDTRGNRIKTGSVVIF